MSSEPETDGPDVRETRAGGRPRSGDPVRSLRRARAVLGRKWHPLIVYRLLAAGPMGFADLKSSLDGVSAKMLSESLDDLERQGLVDRDIVDDRPVRVAYSLTEDGAALEPVLADAIDWEREHFSPGGEGGDR